MFYFNYYVILEVKKLKILFVKTRFPHKEMIPELENVSNILEDSAFKFLTHLPQFAPGPPSKKTESDFFSSDQTEYQ